MTRNDLKLNRAIPLTILFLILIIFSSSSLLSQEPVRFEDHFLDKAMRINFYLVGEAKEEQVIIHSIYQEELLAGKPDQPDQPLQLRPLLRESL